MKEILNASMILLVQQVILSKDSYFFCEISSCLFCVIRHKYRNNHYNEFVYVKYHDIFHRDSYFLFYWKQRSDYKLSSVAKRIQLNIRREFNFSLKFQLRIKEQSSF